jgi:hypothetical protein
LDFIKALRSVSYYRNNDESKKTEYGFIAQEVAETLTKAGANNNGIITKDDAGMLSMRYNDLIAPMVKAIQEQQEQIKLLQQQGQEQQVIIEAYKLKNSQLENRLKLIEEKLSKL